MEVSEYLVRAKDHIQENQEKAEEHHYNSAGAVPGQWATGLAVGGCMAVAAAHALACAGLCCLGARSADGGPFLAQAAFRLAAFYGAVSVGGAGFWLVWLAGLGANAEHAIRIGRPRPGCAGHRRGDAAAPGCGLAIPLSH